MTIAQASQSGRVGSAPAGTHPLQRLSAEEIRAARALFERHGLVGTTTRFAFLGLEEPDKRTVLDFSPGEPVDRRVRAVLLDTATGAAQVVVASITRGEIDSTVQVDPAVDGQPAVLLEELETVDEIVKADDGWRNAMARRGITDLDLVVLPAVRGQFRSLHRARAPGATRLVVPATPTRGPLLGSPDRRDGRLRRPCRAASHRPDRRRVPTGPRRRGQRRRRCLYRPATHQLEAHRDHPAGGDQLLRRRRRRTWQNWTFRVGFDPAKGSFSIRSRSATVTASGR